MTVDPQRSVDYVARIADAWDGTRGALRPPKEHYALLALAGLSPELWRRPWNSLSADERLKLLEAARRAVALGRACAWVFGEGRGA